jgi:ketosteroid isomerase-like protein
MSRNVELIRQGLDAFSRRDIDAAVADMHPDVEWHVAFQLPDLPLDKTIYNGPDEVRELWAAFSSAWDELTVTVEEVLEDSGDTTIVRARFVGRPYDIDVAINRTIFYVFEISDSLLRRLRPFDTEAEARAAAGVQSG